MQAVPKTDRNQALELSEREIKLVRLIRETGFGEIRIFVTDGQPVRAEEVKKSIKL